SWAFEAQWRRLRYECAGRLNWRYCMGGLIADWQSYDDPFNDIRGPAQMGPQWFQVQKVSGMPLDEHIWQADPPASSYPACIAVKAAECQGQTIADAYLRRLREAAMMESRNIARRDILLAVARQTASESARDRALNLARFEADLDSPETVEAFRQDLQNAAYHSIGRFPTLILRRNDGRGIVLVGYHPYDALCAALEHLMPGLCRTTQLSGEDLAVGYVTHWRRITARELAEISGGDTDAASVLLESLVTRGKLRRAEDSQSETPVYVPISER
ncbi:MAG TPA: DsbA family protein, partial [Ktedonobacteraceae bacterium]